MILAGAGSGKTRVITYRITHLLEQGVKPWNILAVTFTNKAAGEMKERVTALSQEKGAGVWISTFHSFCAQFLRTEGSRYGLDRGFTIYDDDDQKKLVRDCLRELNLDDKKIKPGAVLNRISREKDQLMDAESFSIAALGSGDPQKQMLAGIYSLYQKKLESALALDFGDLIMKSVEFLQAYPDLREKYQERFRHILVDEYQDTNRAQYMLTKTLAARHQNLCVVGDDDQSIYSWRGADIRNILDFEKDYKAVKTVKLEQNYRSTAPILSAAWSLVRNNEQRKEKKLWTARESETPVKTEQLANELQEARFVADKILEVREDKGWGFQQFSVFYRTNAQSRVLEDALRSARIPYVLVGNVRFYERAEVKDVLAYLRLITNPKDDLSFKRILNTPPRGLGKVTLEALEKFSALRSIPLYQAMSDPEFLNTLGGKAREGILLFKKITGDLAARKDTLRASEMTRDVLERSGMLKILEEDAKNDLEAAERLDNVQELLNATAEFDEASEDKSTAAYLAQVSLLTTSDDKQDKADKVTLMTVHIAKGLEFTSVFLTGMEEGLFPLGEAQFGQEELEEERRLAYVGMTRAKEQLYLTCAASRRLYGQTRWNLPSRFIAEAGLKVEGRPQTSDDDLISPDALPPRSIRSGPKTSLRVGDRVRHAEFGTGKVTDRSGEGVELKVVVVFDNGQWKKLLVKYAPLEKI